MSSGRPIQFDPDWALNAATTAFWSKGYEATSMQDLLGATHLSKSSLYQAFGGKPELFRRCLVHYEDDMVRQLHERLRTANSSLDFLRETLMQIAGEGVNTTTPRGCLIMNTAAGSAIPRSPNASIRASRVSARSFSWRSAAARKPATSGASPPLQRWRIM
jgi:TetR/AcrR family transcriptional regulator, transcriptional repressor for nem operon